VDTVDSAETIRSEAAAGPGASCCNDPYDFSACGFSGPEPVSAADEGAGVLEARIAKIPLAPFGYDCRRYM